VGQALSKRRVNISKLREEDSEKVDQLKKFLEEKIGASVEVSGDELILNLEEKIAIGRSYLRETLRKFLHKADLEEDFRIISGGNDSFIVKDKKKYEE